MKEKRKEYEIKQKTGVEKVLDAFQTAFHGAAENFK